MQDRFTRTPITWLFPSSISCNHLSLCTHNTHARLQSLHAALSTFIGSQYLPTLKSNFNVSFAFRKMLLPLMMLLLHTIKCPTPVLAHKEQRAERAPAETCSSVCRNARATLVAHRCKHVFTRKINFTPSFAYTPNTTTTTTTTTTSQHLREREREYFLKDLHSAFASCAAQCMQLHRKLLYCSRVRACSHIA